MLIRVFKDFFFLGGVILLLLLLFVVSVLRMLYLNSHILLCSPLLDDVQSLLPTK